MLKLPHPLNYSLVLKLGKHGGGTAQDKYNHNIFARGEGVYLLSHNVAILIMHTDCSPMSQFVFLLKLNKIISFFFFPLCMESSLTEIWSSGFMVVSSLLLLSHPMV